MAQVGNLIVVGTYEQFVVGFAIVPDEKNENKLTLVQTIACHSHKASVRAVAVGGTHLASGGSDETIQLYDVVDKVQGGLLNHHTGTVNALAFTQNGSHLLTAGDDGMISVVRTGSWFVEKKWVGTHSGSAVTGISVHPSGKLALSIGTDNRLVTWNLVKGRKAYVTDLSSRCRNGQGVGDVQWSPSGSAYAVFMASHVEVYSVETAGISHSIPCSNKITSIAFLEDETILVGEESGEASIHKLFPPESKGEEGEKEEIVRFQAHDRRVKCAQNFGPVADGSRDAIQFVTAGGNGRLCLWEFEDSEVEKVCEVGTGCRITCMALFDWSKELNLDGVESGTAEKTISKDLKQVNKNKNSDNLKKAKKRNLSESSDSSINESRKSRSKTSSRATVTSKLTKDEKSVKSLSNFEVKSSKVKKVKKSKPSTSSQWVVTPMK